MDGWQHSAAFGWCPKSSLRNALRPLRLCGDSFLRIDSPLRRRGRRGRRGSQRIFFELGHDPAFVIQFRADANIEAELFEGKVEHVATCQSIRFHSVDELLAFMAAVLAQVRYVQEL